MKFYTLIILAEMNDIEGAVAEPKTKEKDVFITSHSNLGVVCHQHSKCICMSAETADIKTIFLVLS